MLNTVKRGDIYFSELWQGKGAEQLKDRPVIVLQNNIGNRYGNTIIGALLSSSTTKKDLPTHVRIEGYGLKRPSIILLEHIVTIDKRRLKTYLGHVDSNSELMSEINKALYVSLVLTRPKFN